MTLTRDDAAFGARARAGTGAGSGAAQPGWSLGRLFMLRVAAMPFGAVDALRGPRARHMGRVRSRSRRVRSAGGSEQQRAAAGCHGRHP